MKDISILEKVLSRFLTHEQIFALIEEISKGVAVVNGIIDKNEKVKAKKELVVETFKSIDRMIGQSDKIPSTFKLFYDAAKTKIHDMLEPIISGMVMENDFSDLDDIPDVKKTTDQPRHESAEKPQNNQNVQQNSGEQQGGRRRRNRRHGRNRNNNHNVETFPETSQAKPMMQPEPAPEPKPVQKPAPKPVETFHETSLPTESKPKPARKGRTPKKPAETPAPKSEPKPVETAPETAPAKPARKGRTSRKPKETKE